MIPDELAGDNRCDDGAGNGEQHGVSLGCAPNYGMRPEPRMNGVLRIQVAPRVAVARDPLSDAIRPAIVVLGVSIPGSRKRRCNAGRF
jgi:hypothetical protein